MDINNETMADLHRTISGAFRGALASTAVPEIGLLATTIRSSSSSNLYPFMGETGGMREWVGDANFEQLQSYRYSIENRKFQKGLEALRDQIVDDQGGMAPQLSSQAEIIARACASHPDELVIAETLAGADTILCYDGQPAIDDSHPNANGDGGVQSNDMGGSGTAWYIMNLSAPVKFLIYQLREALRLDSLTDMQSSEVFKTHIFKWNAWMRDAAGFGPWQTCVRSKQTLDETNFVAARAALESFHIGEKDPLTGTYRRIRQQATHLVVPLSLRDTARKLLTQNVLANGERNYLENALSIHVSMYL